MRTTFIVMSITALLAAGAGSAAAQPMDARPSAPAGNASDTRTTAAERALAERALVARSAALQRRYEGRDLTVVAPDKQVSVTRAPRSSGSSPVAVAQTGFDWGDAVVGAGLLALLLGLTAGGAAAVRRDRPVAAR